jgi:predicted glycosyltransferase
MKFEKENSIQKKNILFFFVHPSKFHVFRSTINALKANGHNIDVVITSKDVLENLVKGEGWEYTNIFPEGRKMKNVSPYISSAINLVKTIYRLFKYTKGKKYDLFVTDDLLVYVGKLKGIPSIVFCDDDLAVVKQFFIILSMCDYCLAPKVTNLGKYNDRKIGFDSYKELAYLHPNYFSPNEKIIQSFKGSYEKYFIVRLVSLRSYHDVGISGIDYNKAIRLVNLLSKYGKVYISAERPLEEELEPYRIHIPANDFKHVLSGAYLYVGDSQTMSSEAAVLGVPSYRINDFVGKISIMEEKDKNYGLSKSFRTNQFDELIENLELCLQNDLFKTEMQERRKKMLCEKIDLTKFMIWFFENFPKSAELILKDNDYQYKFR